MKIKATALCFLIGMLSSVSCSDTESKSSNMDSGQTTNSSADSDMDEFDVTMSDPGTVQPDADLSSGIDCTKLQEAECLEAHGRCMATKGEFYDAENNCLLPQQFVSCEFGENCANMITSAIRTDGQCALFNCVLWPSDGKWMPIRSCTAEDVSLQPCD